MTDMKHGALAYQELGEQLPLEVLRSASGYYLGTQDETGPVSRESEEYWRTEPEAKQALAGGGWTQRQSLIDERLVDRAGGAEAHKAAMAAMKDNLKKLDGRFDGCGWERKAAIAYHLGVNEKRSEIEGRAFDGSAFLNRMATNAAEPLAIPADAMGKGVRLQIAEGLKQQRAETEQPQNKTAQSRSRGR